MDSSESRSSFPYISTSSGVLRAISERIFFILIRKEASIPIWTRSETR